MRKGVLGKDLTVLLTSEKNEFAANINSTSLNDRYSQSRLLFEMFIIWFLVFIFIEQL